LPAAAVRRPEPKNLLGLMGKRMGWVNDAVKELAAGRQVQVRPFGGSMRGRIESGQLVTLAPVDPAGVHAGDVVLVQWKGNYLLHLVKEVSGCITWPSTRHWTSRGSTRSGSGGTTVGSSITIRELAWSIIVRSSSGMRLRPKTKTPNKWQQLTRHAGDGFFQLQRPLPCEPGPEPYR
jgi:hypothetical protein